MQFSYTADRTGAYMEPASTVISQYKVLEGDPIFPAIWIHIICNYPGHYTPTTSTILPLGPDYPYPPPFVGCLRAGTLTQEMRGEKGAASYTILT